MDSQVQIFYSLIPGSSGVALPRMLFPYSNSVYCVLHCVLLSDTLVRILRIQPVELRVLMLLYSGEICRDKLSRPPLYVVWPKALNYSILRNSGNWPSKSDTPP